MDVEGAKEGQVSKECNRMIRMENKIRPTERRLEHGRFCDRFSQEKRENSLCIDGARGLKHSRTAQESRGGRALSGGYLEIRTRPVNISIEYRISFASIYRAIRVRVPEGILKIQRTCRPAGAAAGKGQSSSLFKLPSRPGLSSIDSTRAPVGTSALIRLLRDQRWRTCEDACLKRETKFHCRSASHLPACALSCSSFTNGLP